MMIIHDRIDHYDGHDDSDNDDWNNKNDNTLSSWIIGNVYTYDLRGKLGTNVMGSFFSHRFSYSILRSLLIYQFPDYDYGCLHIGLLIYPVHMPVAIATFQQLSLNYNCLLKVA